MLMVLLPLESSQQHHLLDLVQTTGLPAGGVGVESGGSSLGAGVTILNFRLVQQ